MKEVIKDLVAKGGEDCSFAREMKKEKIALPSIRVNSSEWKGRAISDPRLSRLSDGRSH